jgi:hypothetical protein
MNLVTKIPSKKLAYSYSPNNKTHYSDLNFFLK